MSYANKVVKMMESLIKSPKRKLRENQDDDFVFDFQSQDYNGKSPDYDKFQSTIKNISDPETQRIADIYYKDLGTVLYTLSKADYVYDMYLETADITVSADNSGGAIYANVVMKIDSEPDARDLEYFDEDDPDYEDSLEELKEETVYRRYQDLGDKMERLFRDRLQGWDGEYNLEQSQPDYDTVIFTCDLFESAE